MIHLFKVMGKVQEMINQASGLLLALDFDGTLCPIVNRPEQATLSAQTRQLMATLAGCPNVLVAVISGRAISDVRERIGIEGILYCGNHGLQIEGKGINQTTPDSQNLKQLMSGLQSDLSKTLAIFPGVIVENKGLGLAVHYRQASKTHISSIKAVVARAAHLERPIRLSQGKKVLELRPKEGRDKGRTLEWLIHEAPSLVDLRTPGNQILPMYIGDDLTDEDAFYALKKRGLSIRVGRPTRKTAADYHLRNPAEVTKLLSQLPKLVQPFTLSREPAFGNTATN